MAADAPPEPSFAELLARAEALIEEIRALGSPPDSLADALAEFRAALARIRPPPPPGDP